MQGLRLRGSLAVMLVRALPGAVSLTGLGLVGAGLWARHDVRRTLAAERVVGPADGAPVQTAASARALAELIRGSTLEAAGGRTYPETEDGSSEQQLWLQSMTLQTALMQAYIGFRVAELTAGLGAALIAVGVALQWPRR